MLFWSGKDEEAINHAKRALEFDSNAFDSNALLGEIYANRDEHEFAARHVRLGLENYPEPVPDVPEFMFKILRCLSFLHRRSLNSFNNEPHRIDVGDCL